MWISSILQFFHVFTPQRKQSFICCFEFATETFYLQNSENAQKFCENAKSQKCEFVKKSGKTDKILRGKQFPRKVVKNRLIPKKIKNGTLA